MKESNNVYIYDGTIEGLFTIVYKCMTEKVLPLNVIKDKTKLSLFENYITIDTDLNISNKIFNSIPKRMSDMTLYNVYNAFLSSKNDKEINIVNYLINGYKYGKNLNKIRTLDSIVKVQKYSNMVRREAHKLKGFIRFEDVNGILYSKIAPEHDVLEILIPHFKNRLKNETWVIEDTKRNKAVFYDKNKYKVISTIDLDLNKLSKKDNDKTYKELWKIFIKSVMIKERKNLRCQMNFMPKRYWKYMTEMEDINE